MEIALLVVAAILAVVVGWHAFEFLRDRKLFRAAQVRNLRARQARRLLDEQSDIQLVDVRPGAGYRSGHLPGAVNVPYEGGTLDVAASRRLDPGKPVLIYCDGGYRSRLALPAFEKAGFPEIFHLHRGYLSWRLGGGEIESDST
ncbi:MAG: rhodanese-like domain-containing protein [Verrucomicrobiales bacterium]